MAASDKPLVKRVSTGDPRKNFLGPVSRKRTETKFVIAFGQAYARRLNNRGKLTSRSHVMARELSVSGFGIADFVSIAWRSSTESNEAFIDKSSPPTKSRRARILAFEMKLKDWRKALSQAFRYRYFADAALVVVPPETAARAIVALSTFRETQVGLWSFDEKTGRIQEIFTPRRARPFSETAREKAIAILSRELRIPPIS